MPRIERVAVAITALVVIVGVGLWVASRYGAGETSFEVEPRTGRIEEWETLRDSAAVSLESPATEQQLDNAYVVPAGGSRIPMRKFVIQIDLITDFDCPACRAVERVVEEQLRRYPIHARSLIHLPSRSRWAMDAAKAFDCAYDDGQAVEMYAVLRARHQDFGTVSWDSLAREAQVYDTAAFTRCIAAPPSGRIRAGMALAEKLGLREAPAVVVDGWLMPAPTAEELAAALAEARDNRRTGR